MKISEAWLRSQVNPSVSTAELVAQLTMAGLEVDAVEPVAAEFSGVVVGEVLEKIQHPNADKLSVCQVNVGQGEPLQIVCGASNVRVGLKIPAALIGAVLPGDFKIQKSKLRGEVSHGMLCSEKELGLATASNGLMELPADAPVGVNIREYLQLDDNSIELGLTPNRADCLSVEGIAREVAVLNTQPFSLLAPTAAAVSHQDNLPIRIEAPQACPRYLGRLIKNINFAATTPLWMQERLRRSGIRSLSPVVDVTNYVLLELGQPLHAFDAAKLNGGIVVRISQAGESLELLNGQTISLDGSALVIADAQQALALAGVMGGQSSAVSDTTRDIFLECAFFTPLHIAGKARQFGLHTDSSHRFERGVDFELQHRAIERATQLIVELVGGEVGVIQEQVYPEHLPQRAPIRLRAERIEKMLGIQLSDTEITALFNGLGMAVAAQDNGWAITPPSFRFDMAIEEDLLEEIARIVGYNNLPSSSLLMRSELGKAAEAFVPLDRFKDALVDRGYQEAITYSFVDEAIQNAVAPDAELIRIQNPISSELSIMRTSLWCGLLNAALYNTHRQQNRVRLFESGLRFLSVNGETVQQKMLAGLILGTAQPEQWGDKNRKVDFFDLKGDVEALLALTGCAFSFAPTEHPALHPGQAAEICNAQGEKMGVLGMLHPSLEKQLGFDMPVYLFELAQDGVLNRQIPKFKPLSKYPSVRRDMALLVAEPITAAQIVACVESSQEASVREVSIFDIYRGQGVAEGHKSVALSLMLQDDAQTLTESEIDAIFNKILNNAKTTLNAKLRD